MSKSVKSSQERSITPSKQANVYHIERFGTVDGPGIRYVLFLKGCPFRCKYCHNRDSWSTEVKTLMTASEVIADYQKYASFYENGGLTISGGEPLLQSAFLLELCQLAKKKQIHVTLDTAAASYHTHNQERIHEILRYVDLVLLDIKAMSDTIHRDLVGTSNQRVLAFAKYLQKIAKPTWIRHVLIPYYTLNIPELKALATFIKPMTNVLKIEVLPYHKMGDHKWKDLGIKNPLEGIIEPNSMEVALAEKILKDKK